MTQAQKKLREALDRQSRQRGRMAEIGVLAEDAWTPEIRSEFEQLEKAVPDTEAQVRAARAAVEAEEGEQRQASIEHPDGGQRERLELRSRCRVGNILAAALAGRATSGAEAELQADLGFSTSEIPAELWQRPERRDARETRAISPAPSTVGINMADVEPFVFAPSIASRLGIAFRRVPSGTYAVPTITTAPSTAAPKDKSGAADATAGAMTVQSATPKRVPARLELAVEDVAAFGNETFEASLREALSAKLSDSLDNQVINGNGTAPNLNGLINQLTALWPNGRSEVHALCPGIPDLDERERMDAIPRGLYRRLHADGVLLVDEGLRVSRPSVLIEHLFGLGIHPAAIYCDRFHLGQLEDAVRGRCPVVPRTTRWSEATEDIAAFRRLVADGPLSIVAEGGALAALALSQASVLSDDQGSVRLQKKRHGRSRDDVAVCGVLAAGALVRHLGREQHRPRWRYRGAA